MNSWQLRTTHRGDPDWLRYERDLDGARIPISLQTRHSWATLLTSDAILVSAHDASGACRAAAGLEIQRSRALPGHRFILCHKIGSVAATDAGLAVIGEVTALARRLPRVLMLHVGLSLRSPEDHLRVSNAFNRLGYALSPQPRGYRESLVIDLRGTEQAILGTFSATTRRELKHWHEQPVELREIDDPKYVTRLEQLTKETFGRTGSVAYPRPWQERIELCRSLPNASRLVGLFRSGRDDPDALLAYAWACGHGDFTHYDDAGSTRTDDIKLSLMYPLMWDLICWARKSGSSWFDMGGVTSGTRTSGDPRGGISDFKRRFSKTVVQVGEEWIIEPNPWRAQLARRLGHVRKWLSDGLSSPRRMPTESVQSASTASGHPMGVM